MASKKAPAEKTEVKAVKKAAVKKAAPVVVVEKTVAVEKPVRKAGKAVSVDVLDVKGKVVESMVLPSEMFGVAVNKTLLAQAVRVYLANQRQGTARTKSRGEVTGSTRKIYRQKGTGRARHGGITAPIFVGGGIAHGPKPRDYSMDLPKKMKKAALFSALTTKHQDNAIKFVTGLEKLTGKTKEVALVMNVLSGAVNGKNQSVLVVTDNSPMVSRAARNISHVTLLPANQVNAYAILRAHTVVVMKDAVSLMEKTFLGKE